jgi:hypothetical protein
MLRLFSGANSLSSLHRVARISRRFSATTTIDSSLSAGSERKSSRSRRKERKENESALGTLEWETFDFSDSPKWDGRFGDDGDIHLASNTDDWDQLAIDEAQRDKEMQEEFERCHKVWRTLDKKLVEDATNVLLPFIQPDRWERIQSVLSQRTQQSKFLYENPANPVRYSIVVLFFYTLMYFHLTSCLAFALQTSLTFLLA